MSAKTNSSPVTAAAVNVAACVGPSIEELVHVGTVPLLEINFPDGTCRVTTTRPPNTHGMIITKKTIMGVDLPRIITTYTKTTPVVEAVLALGDYKLMPTNHPDDFLLCRSGETVAQLDVMLKELAELRLIEASEQKELKLGN